MKVASGDDLLKVLTIGYTIRFSRSEEHTLTLLSLAIFKCNDEYVNSILIHSQNNGTLQEIINTENIINYRDGLMYTLISLGFAIHHNKPRLLMIF